MGPISILWPGLELSTFQSLPLRITAGSYRKSLAGNAQSVQKFTSYLSPSLFFSCLFYDDEILNDIL